MKLMLKVMMIVTCLFAAGLAQAKCYRFSNAPDDTFVCVGKNGSDSSSDRKKAQDICSEKAGRDCGSVGSTSSSCHSNKGLCYDENGGAQRSLSGY